MSHFTCVSVSRCIGALRVNLEMDNRGLPNGYMVVEVDGDNIEWWYKVPGHDRDYQMRAYSPVITGDGYVKANIWNYSPDSKWSAVEWWENDKKVGEFEQFSEFDPEYLRIYTEKFGHTNGGAKKYAKPEESCYMFRIKPSEGVRSGEIRVTDSFGKTYTEKVEW